MHRINKLSIGRLGKFAFCALAIVGLSAAQAMAQDEAQSRLLGNMGGLRPFLGTHGWTFDAVETSEVFGNVSGGVRQGAAYYGMTALSLGADSGRAFGWNGGTFLVSALLPKGRNISTDNLSSIQTASGAEADRVSRLWELWYQQSFSDDFDIKIGQQSIDTEFMTSDNSALFINTVMGWPALPSYDLPSGGPAYPLAALGVRARASLSDSLTVLAGVYNGDPVGSGSIIDGTAFRLSDGVLAIGELQYAINRESGLAGTYKIGAWYNSQNFADQRFDTTGLSLADPLSSGVARNHSGNFSVYGLADQTIWKPAPDSPQSLSLFLRAMGAPDAQNMLSFSINGGVTVRAPFAGRDDDSFGIGFGYVKVSGRAAALDRDTAFFTGSPFPVRSGETFIELTYQYQATPWMQLQPDLQFNFNPGGGIQNPANPARRIGDEPILGLRANISL